jgi:hypothetical protein
MKIVIEVRNGSVVAVTSDHGAKELDVVVADYDNIDAGDPGVSELKFGDGETAADLIISGVSVY